MSKYRITLTPIDKFFFGGDMTFQVGDNDKDKFNKRYKSYIIQSSLFPQQTSLLGMLRFLVLRNAGADVFKDGKIVDKNKAKAKELIGGRSFSVNPNHEENSFGLIKSLSHVRVQQTKDGKCADWEFKPLFGELDLNQNAKADGAHNYQTVWLPNLDKNAYNAKDSLKKYLTNGEDDRLVSTFFKEDRRIGISRDIKTGKTGEDALFIQISYRFAQDARYCFAFEAEIDDCLALERYDGQMVSVGGDNSQFIIGITKEKQCKTLPGMTNALYLLSPTFLPREEAKTAAFAITDLMPFRFLSSVMDEVSSYHILSGKLVRSDGFELYAPGSVFYFKSEEDKQKFASLIEAKREFRQIGYNEYQ